VSDVIEEANELVRHIKLRWDDFETYTAQPADVSHLAEMVLNLIAELKSEREAHEKTRQQNGRLLKRIPTHSLTPAQVLELLEDRHRYRTALELIKKRLDPMEPGQCDLIRIGNAYCDARDALTAPKEGDE
jgi:hypothetical protein